jgi:hypothetical protein
MNPKLIIRLAAALTALLAVAALGVLAMATVRIVSQEANSPWFYKKLGVFGLIAIVPGMFIWAAIQAWRGNPKGIVSLSSGWMLFGLGGSIGYLFWFFIQWKIQDALMAVVWIGVFLFGLLIARQGKKIENQLLAR